MSSGVTVMDITLSLLKYWVGSKTMTFASVVTPKPANGGQGKTGQREEAGDSVVLSCRLLWRQV